MGERVDASKRRRGDQTGGTEGGEQGRRAEVDRPTRQCADCSEREGKRETAGFETDGKRRERERPERLSRAPVHARREARARASNALRRVRQSLFFLALLRSPARRRSASQ